MAFEIFHEHVAREEVRTMLLELKKGGYAISTVPKEIIEDVAKQFDVPFSCRNLKDGRVKVMRIQRR